MDRQRNTSGSSEGNPHKSIRMSDVRFVQLTRYEALVRLLLLGFSATQALVIMQQPIGRIRRTDEDGTSTDLN